MSKQPLYYISFILSSFTLEKRLLSPTRGSMCSIIHYVLWVWLTKDPKIPVEKYFGPVISVDRSNYSPEYVYGKGKRTVVVISVLANNAGDMGKPFH